VGLVQQSPYNPGEKQTFSKEKAMPHHPLHEVIGDLLAASVPPTCTLVKDPACRGDQCIPLFCSDKKSFATKFCNVDLLILCDRDIRVIVEIEEANVKPTQIAGKFLTSALSSHFIHRRHGGQAVPKGDQVLFLQIVDTSGLSVRTAKKKQWRNIEKGIRDILPLGGITEYKLIYGDETDFQGQAGQQVVEAIREAWRQSQVVI
jgi:hypothetical protein